jgi:hypothetical protein
MNYFAHGRQHTDRPWFLVGTALPDLLSSADRRVRLRSKRVEPFADGSGSALAELAAGVLRHLADDQWFHETRAFFEVSGELSRMFRALLGPDDGFRPGFLGHIVTEILLDAVLIERHPALLDRYYAALAQIDPQTVQDAVNRMAKVPTDQIVPFLPLFCEVQFLRDYVEPERLLFRLNQVMRRVKLKPLPAETMDLLQRARPVVTARADELLAPSSELKT